MLTATSNLIEEQCKLIEEQKDIIQQLSNRLVADSNLMKKLEIENLELRMRNQILNQGIKK